MIVLDASCAISLVTGDPETEFLRKTMENDPFLAQAPSLMPLESASVLRRFERTGTLSSVLASQAIQDLFDLTLVLHDPTPFLPRIWELRKNLNPYDASYIALAEELKAPLFTLDKKLARAPGHRAKVQVL